jgi:hypothetical protein
MPREGLATAEVADAAFPRAVTLRLLVGIGLDLVLAGFAPNNHSDEGQAAFPAVIGPAGLDFNATGRLSRIRTKTLC